LGGREDDAFVAVGNGLTDLVKRPTGAAAELRPEEMASGAAALHAKIEKWRPGLVLFAYRPPADYLLGRAGVAPGLCDDLDGVPTFLLSGPYASVPDTERIDRELTALLHSLGNSKSSRVRGKRKPSATKNKSRTSTRAGAKRGRTQRVTAADLRHHRIRFPKAAKWLFPAQHSQLRVDLRGTLLDAHYDPRLGPDRERSAVLVFGTDVSPLILPDEVLTIRVGTGGVIRLR
jgi:hypothetical protein